MEVECHARLFNLRGNTRELKSYLESNGYVVAWCGLDEVVGHPEHNETHVIFGKASLRAGMNSLAEGQVNFDSGRLVVYLPSRLEQVIDEYRQTASARDSSPAQNEQSAG